MPAQPHSSREVRGVANSLMCKVPDGEFYASALKGTGTTPQISGILRSWKGRGWVRIVKREKDPRNGQTRIVWAKTKDFGKKVKGH